MHFVISAFVALMCLVSYVLFIEVFAKWFKVLLTVLGSLTTGYALAILLRKIAEMSSAFAKPALWTTSGIAAVIVFIIAIVVKTIIQKKKA